ncbi:hypothetical protein BD309DRAFT_952245, partial [Dichomitus squalens]
MDSGDTALHNLCVLLTAARARAKGIPKVDLSASLAWLITSPGGFSTPPASSVHKHRAAPIQAGDLPSIINLQYALIRQQTLQAFTPAAFAIGTAWIPLADPCGPRLSSSAHELRFEARSWDM